MNVKRFSVMVVVLCMSFTMTGCTMLMAAGGEKLIMGHAENKAQNEPVTESLPALKSCQNPEESIYKCMSDPGNGDIYVVIPKSDNSVEDRKKVRAMAKKAKAGLPAGVSIDKEMPLVSAPIFPEREAFSFDYLARKHFTGTWLVVSQ